MRWSDDIAHHEGKKLDAASPAEGDVEEKREPTSRSGWLMPDEEEGRRMLVIVLNHSREGERLLGISGRGQPLSEDEVHPYKSFEDINELLLAISQQRLPRWFSLLQDFHQGSDFAYCHADLLKTNRTSYKRSNLAKTMVCHDYKGGYLNDRFINVSYDMTGYVFKEWALIDSFVYFSHYFVTVPPLCWINAGHAHGVSVLGTIITEGEGGRAIWDRLLTSERHWKWFAEALALINKLHKSDGYLLNIENSLTPDQAPTLLEFVKYLRKIMPETSLLIWYDSINIDGRLVWQNALNKRNMDFFNACDGIFLNYNYQNWQLELTASVAEDRKHDVYVGVDVFGRGCPGTGFFSCGIDVLDAVAMARNHDLSVAIFAPGWTEEVASGDPLRNAQIFWSNLSKYLYVHGTARSVRTRYALCDKEAKIHSTGKDPFPWVTSDSQYVFPLPWPSTDPDRERQVVLHLQEAVLTFKETDVENFYYRLPHSFLKITNFSRDCKALFLNTHGLAEKIKFPLMIVETVVRKGFLIDIETFEDSTTTPMGPSGGAHMNQHAQVRCYAVVDIVPNGNIQTFKFDMIFSKIRFKNSFVKELRGTLLEVGLEVDPHFKGYITSVSVSPHLRNHHEASVMP